jgi:predicted phage terminase large subunit-like protein
MLAGYRIVATPETGAKTVRAMPVASQVSAGTVAIRRAAWNTAFLDELASFPHGRKDDQVDALARAFGLLISQAAPARFAHLAFSAR